MRQKLCRRLEELEKVNAAASAAQQAKTAAVDREALHKRLWAMMEACPPSPERQEWLAKQPPDYLYHAVAEVRAQLRERADRHRSVQAGRFR